MFDIGVRYVCTRRFVDFSSRSVILTCSSITFIYALCLAPQYSEGDISQLVWSGPDLDVGDLSVYPAHMLHAWTSGQDKKKRRKSQERAADQRGCRSLTFLSFRPLSFLFSFLAIYPLRWTNASANR